MKKLTIIFIILGIIGIISVANLFLFLHRDYDCSDFKTYDEALKVFSKYSYDKYDLDGNHNGKPCERLLNNK